MRGLQGAIERFYKIIKPVSTVFNAIGMVTLAAMMFLTAIDVILRKAINAPIVGSYEIIQFMMGITVAFGLAYCAVEKGHVTVDIIENRLSKRTRGIVHITTGLLGIVIASLISWQTCAYIVSLYQSHLLSSVLLIPVYPLVALVAFGIIMFTLVLVIHLLEFIQEVKGE
jgi:TRAP-type C4-dicarboxylate transport system permease small subunit